jgi:copper chaperone NosL
MSIRQVALVSLVSALAALNAGCAGPSAQPAALQAGDTCAFCRMAVSDARFAGQLAAPGEDPLFFDDIGCLAGHLQRARPADEAVAYVADHRTAEWIEARAAIFTRVETLATPMGSHLVAHRDASSRDQDPASRQGLDVAMAEIFGGTLSGWSDDAR